MSVLPQQPPVPNQRAPIWREVVADMQARDAFGYRKYGTRLQPFNGRDTAVDAYQEVLDLTAYLKQLVIEWDAAQDILAGALEYAATGDPSNLIEAVKVYLEKRR